jgi:hypothetical protein
MRKERERQTNNYTERLFVVDICASSNFVFHTFLVVFDRHKKERKKRKEKKRKEKKEGESESTRARARERERDIYIYTVIRKKTDKRNNANTE